jgi:hypothetical protein
VFLRPEAPGEGAIHTRERESGFWISLGGKTISDTFHQNIMAVVLYYSV